MRIESDSFRELYVPQHVLAAKDERFYEIPGAKDYAISSYGRLFKRLGEFKYKLVRPINIDSPGVLTREGYRIKFDSDNSPRIVSISSIFARVFLSGKHLYLYNPNWWKPCKHDSRGLQLGQKWNIKNLYVFSRPQYVEYIRAKCKNRVPRIPSTCQGIDLAQYDPGVSINTFLNTRYNHMRNRILNKKEQLEKPTYCGVTIEQEILDSPRAFKQHLLDILYEYPSKTLELDKDWFSDSSAKSYSYDTVVFMPREYNKLLVSRPNTALGYRIQKADSGKYYYIGKEKFSTIDQALHAGRRITADKLRKKISLEKNRGLPKYIRDRMLEVADRCQKGQITEWEPTREVLQRERMDHRKRLAQKRKELSTANASPDT